jgi:hypothetical protein
MFVMISLQSGGFAGRGFRQLQVFGCHCHEVFPRIAAVGPHFSVAIVRPD